jgi:hypothetical protein
MPWTEFIPPEAARRTMNTILQQKTLSSTIQLDQVYRHRTGTPSSAALAPLTPLRQCSCSFYLPHLRWSVRYVRYSYDSFW